MSSLTAAEKVYFENVLDMGGGYVLDFTNATFEEFFARHGIEIYGDEKYCIIGPSKANRMRAFWAQDTDETVARVLSDLLDCYEAICETEGREPNVNVLSKSRDAIARLSGRTKFTEPAAVHQFLEVQIELPSLQKLPIESAVVGVIEERLLEAERVTKVGAHLSAVFLCGSVLEAVLLGAAQSNPKEFNQARSSPKTPDGKSKEVSRLDIIGID